MALTGYPKEFRSTNIHSVKDSAGDGSKDVGDVMAGDNTYFKVKAMSTASADYADIKVRYTGGGTVETLRVFAGQSLDGPYAEVEVDAISSANLSVLVYYQSI